MTKLHLNEIELGQRWGVSPKTLQRWRCENRGPAYLKLSKRVTYPIEDIIAFEASQKRVRENSHEVAAQRAANPVSVEGMVSHSASPFITEAEAARATKLPRYYFTNASKRTEMEIPHYFVGKLVRFKLEEILQWEVLQTQRCRVTPVDPIASIFQNAALKADRPSSTAAAHELPKMKLHEALRRLNDGTLDS